MEETIPLKIVVDGQEDTCGTCRFYRSLTVSEEDLAHLAKLQRKPPMICGANPPTVQLAPQQVSSLEVGSNQVIMAPQNFWPFPPANEPACRLWEGR
jgi:hypothetical protein